MFIHINEIICFNSILSILVKFMDIDLRIVIIKHLIDQKKTKC